MLCPSNFYFKNIRLLRHFLKKSINAIFHMNNKAESLFISIDIEKNLTKSSPFHKKVLGNEK
jgi:hypothetical protein